jgi:hypothetical protein
MRENLELISIKYLIAVNCRTVGRMGPMTFNVDIQIVVTVIGGKGMERLGSKEGRRKRYELDKCEEEIISATFSK